MLTFCFLIKREHYFKGENVLTRKEAKQVILIVITVTSLMSAVLCSPPPPDKGPSLRPLTSKSPELELPLLRRGEDEEDVDSPGDEDAEEEQEITLHWRHTKEDKDCYGDITKTGVITPLMSLN